MPRRAVPGHGPVAIDWPAGAADIERYLTTLRNDVKQAPPTASTLTVRKKAAQSESGNWKLFEDYNERNVIAAYKELEWQ